jgi:flagellar motor component MotA
MPIGMFLAFAFMNVANVMEGGDPSHLFGIPALILVLGGTLFTVATAFTPGEVMKMPSLAMKGFKNPPKLD